MRKITLISTSLVLLLVIGLIAVSAKSSTAEAKSTVSNSDKICDNNDTQCTTYADMNDDSVCDNCRNNTLHILEKSHIADESHINSNIESNPANVSISNDYHKTSSQHNNTSEQHNSSSQKHSNGHH